MVSKGREHRCNKTGYSETHLTVAGGWEDSEDQ